MTRTAKGIHVCMRLNYKNDMRGSLGVGIGVVRSKQRYPHLVMHVLEVCHETCKSRLL